ncbi:hypothetical protein ACFLRM_05210 [Acidobacteriota bacterium]
MKDRAYSVERKSLLKKTNSKTLNLFKNLVLLAVSILLGFILLESGAKIIWEKKYNEHLEKRTNSYEYVDHKRGLILSIPNIEKYFNEYRSDLEKQGKVLKLQNLENALSPDKLNNTRVILKINKHGFKGPDFEIPKPESIFRIITIGDSCTWGNEYGNNYPRVM